MSIRSRSIESTARAPTNQNAGNKFSTYERTSFASPTLAFQRARARELLPQSTTHQQHGRSDVHQRRGSGAYTAKTPSPCLARFSGRRMARARAIADWREMLTGNHQNAFWPEPWGFRDACVARGTP